MPRALLAWTLALAAELPLASCGGVPRPAIAGPRPIEVAPAAESAPIGTPHPFTFGAADPHARWVVLCQARRDSDGDGEIAAWTTFGDPEGDALQPYLIFGSGEGQPIDDFLGASVDGGELVLIQRGRLLVHHVREGRTDVLRGADLTDDASLTAPRAVRFDQERRRIVYQVPRPRHHAVDLVVRDLKTGHEVRTRGPERIYHAEFSEAGQWLKVWAVTDDTDGDGALDYPRGQYLPEPRACWRPVATCIGTLLVESYDQLVLQVAPASGGSLREIPGTINAVGPWILARPPGGEVVAHGIDGSVTEWVPSSCQGDILQASATLRRALVACRRANSGGIDFEVHGPGVHRRLATNSHTGPHAATSPLFEVERFTTIVRGESTYLVDLLELREWPVPEGHRLVGSLEDGVILASWRGDVETRWRWIPAEGSLEAIGSASALGEREVFAEAQDGRQLVPQHPPPPHAHPPSSAADASAERDLSAVIDLSPPRLLLGVGPLVWKARGH